MGRLFGTDGVRGVANSELSVELALQLGQAAGRFLREQAGEREGRPAVVVGRDTRHSGPMLEAALCAGLASAGVDVLCAGVLPTPAVAFLTRHWGLVGGAVISASHNPVEDNGIKFFSSQGFKLSDAEEEAIERLMEAEDWPPSSRPVGSAVGFLSVAEGGESAYARFLCDTVTVDVRGWEIVLDCAYGAASRVAPRVFESLGCRVHTLHDEPNGLNINVACGSTHPAVLQQAVVSEGARMGFAFDGDADRVIAVDERGQIVDGDAILAICGLHMLSKGRLPHRAVAATLYSNLGLTEAMRQAGGDVVITPAGDRFVLEAMRERGLTLGGEQSGHIIFLEHTTTGDGLLSALQLLQVVAEKGVPLSELAACMPRFPQVLENVAVPGTREDRRRVVESDAVREAIAAAERKLAPLGRIVVRPSGTEPVVRVMGEGRDERQVREAVKEVVAALEASRQEAPGLSPAP